MKAMGWALATLLAMAGPAGAEDGCFAYVPAAEARYGIPGGLLAAVVRTESGGNPLALNADGTPYYPIGRDQAHALIQSLHVGGARNVDVGCGQISLRHHPSLPPDLALDAARNVDYAAAYLASLYQSHGSWPVAVAHYHSSDPVRQAAYLQRIAHAAVHAAGDTAATPSPRRVTRVGTLYIEAQRIPGMIVRR